MTKKKSIWAFIFAICLIVPAMIMMTACGNEDKGGETEHTHSYSTEWTTDATHHWHAATCEHTDEKDSYGEHTVAVWTVKTEAGLHVDKVEQGTCIICEKVVERTVPNTATHTYSTTWSKNETQHWKESTCEGHTPPLKSEVADHDFVWTEKTPAGVHTDKVETGTCSVCQYQKDRTIEGSGANIHSWVWKANNIKHWQETTCEHETPLKQNEEDHTWVYASEGESTHRRTSNCGAEKHATRIEPNIPHRYTDVNDVDCNDCGHVRGLTGKGSFNALSAKTYNGSAQPVDSSDYTIDEAIKALCEIQYKVKGSNDDTYTTTAPTDAGTYEVRIFCKGNDTYLKGEVAKTDYIIKQIEVKVGISFIIEKQTTSNNYITLETYEVTNPSLPSNVTLTLRAYGEQYKNPGRYNIVKTNGEFEGLEFDNKNFKPIPNKSTLSISIVVYTNEAPVVTGANQTESNVKWIGYATPPYPTITMYQITSGTLRVGDYLICEGVDIPLKVKAIKLNKGSVSGSTSSFCLDIALAGETVDISFETPGFTENDAKTKLINKTFTKVGKEVLAFKEGSNTTNSVDVTLGLNESIYLEFTATVDSAKTFKLNFLSDGGYRANESFEFYNAETGEKMTNNLNEVSVSAAGTYTIVIKITKVAEEYNYLFKTVPFYVQIK